MKVIVAHPGRQHSFRVATALKKEGLLFKYATTVYNKDDSFLMRLTKLFLGEENVKRANRRKCPEVNDSEVVQFCEIWGLIGLLLIRLDKTHKIANAFNEYVSRRFQRKLARYIIKNNVDAVVSYDTNSHILFKILKEKAPHVKRIMDNAHPNRHYLYYSYRENLDCCGPFLKTLQACGYITDEKIASKFGDEAREASHHIVASSYSEKALKFDGVSETGIYKIPYGVDSNKFIEPQRTYARDHLNILFMGEVNQRKGIRQVLEAAKCLDNRNYIFNIVGDGANHCSELYAPYRNDVNILGYVSFEELLHQLATSHVFVFPTMGEGFGLVLLEAMAAGVVPITTENCAGRDIVEDGVNGFIIPVGDTDRLVEVVKWCGENPESLAIMAEKARTTAADFTWERYEKGIVSAIHEIVK